MAVASVLANFTAWLEGYGESSWDHQSYFAGPMGGRAKALYYRNKLLGTAAVYVIWRWVLLPKLEAEARAAREQLRHERARRDIDRIALETSRAMYEAALTPGEVIEGTAVEVDRS